MNDNTLTEFLRGVVGVVEANSFEKHMLWKDRGTDVWEGYCEGYLETVGHINKRPVCLSILVDVVNGHRLLFIEPTSQLVDHKMIDAWLLNVLPATAYRDFPNDPPKIINRTDAMNFRNIFRNVQYIQE